MVNINGHASVVRRRYVSWNDALNKRLREYYCFNSRITPSEIVLSSLNPQIFAGISANDITNWRRKNKRDIGNTRRKSTLRDAFEMPKLFAAAQRTQIQC